MKWYGVGIVPRNERQMKIKFTFLLVSLFLLISCGDEKETMEAEEVSLKGEWLSTYRSYTDCTDVEYDQEETFQDVPCVEGDENGCTYQSVEFTETKMVSHYTDIFFGGFFESIDESSYTIEGTEITMCYEDGADCETWYFMISEDVLEFTGVDEDGCNFTWRLKKV